MRLKLTYPVEDLRGAGSRPTGIVFSRWRGVATARTYVVPRNPQTAAQTSVRSYLTQAAQGFQSISPAQKVLWEDYAAAHPSQSLSGEYVQSAIAMYVRINALRLLDGQALSATPPSDLVDWTVTDVTAAEYGSGTGTMALTISHTGTSGADLLKIEATAALPSQVRDPQEGDYRLGSSVLATSIAAVEDTGTPMDVADWRNVLTDGQYIGLRLTPLSPDYDPGTPYTEVIAVSVT